MYVCEWLIKSEIYSELYQLAWIPGTEGLQADPGVIELGIQQELTLAVKIPNIATYRCRINAQICAIPRFPGEGMAYGCGCWRVLPVRTPNFLIPMEGGIFLP